MRNLDVLTDYARYSNNGSIKCGLNSEKLVMFTYITKRFCFAFTL